MAFVHCACLFAGALIVACALGCRRYVARHFTHPQRVRCVGIAAGLILVASGIVGLIHCRAGMGLDAWCVTALAASGVALATVVAVAVESRIVTPSAGRPRRILAVGAHPDDLELACGGTLAKLADAGHEIHGLVMSRGAKGGDSSVRVGEAERGAHFMGLVEMTVHDFPDTALESCTNALRETIEAAMERIQPDIIFTHSGHDQHQDHHAVHLATLRAARQHHSILCYESPSTTRDFNPSFFVDIDDYVGTKVHAVQTHRNQAGKPYMTPERVRGMASFRGGQAKGGSAEAFEPVRLAASSLGVLY